MRKKLFYGWIVLIACCAIMCSVFGIISNCFSLLLKPICQETGWSRESVGLFMTFFSISGMAASAFAYRVYKIVPSRIMFRAAAIVCAVSYFATSFLYSKPAFYAVRVVCGIAYVYCTMLPIVRILSAWFYERRGLVIGIATMGTGLGGSLFNFLSGKWIALYGWRTTVRIQSLIILAVVIPCVFFIIKETPEEMGLKPYGMKETGPREEPSLTLKDLLKKPEFYLCCIFFAFASTFGAMASQVTAPHLSDIGYSELTASRIFSIAFLVMAAGKPIAGMLVDKIGVRKSSMLAYGFCGIGFLGLIFGNHYWGIALFMLGMFFGYTYINAGNPMIVTALFGRKNYTLAYGIVSAFGTFGSSFTSTISGAVFDSVKSYRPVYIGAVLISAVVVLMAFYMCSPKKLAKN